MADGEVFCKVYVDWDKDYNFDDADEDISAYVTNVEIERAKADTLNAGICTLTLLNDDRRFDPQYSSGPYYPNIKVGRWVRILMSLYEAGPGVVFDGADSSIVVSDNATIQDLHDAEFTVEAWVRADSWGEASYAEIVGKWGSSESAGWVFRLDVAGGLSGIVRCATTDAISTSGLDEFFADGRWHHVAMYFDDAGDRTVYLAVDGEWISSYPTQIAGVGAVVSDSGEDLYIGNSPDGDRTFDGVIGWARISDNDRYSIYETFNPPRLPPTVDARTVAQWNFDEGSGSTADNAEGTAALDGTLSDCEWFDGILPVHQFLGFLDEIAPERMAETDEEQFCTLTCYDLLALLEVDKITTGTLIDYGSKELIQLILASIGWGGLAAFDTAQFDVDRFAGPGADYNVLDDGQTTFPYCQFDDMTLAEAIRQVLEAEHGDFWIRKNGYAMFEDRHHRIKDKVSVATIQDTQISELILQHVYSDLFNNIEVIAHPRSVGTAGTVVWQGVTDTGRIIPVGESVDYGVSYSDPESGLHCEAIDVVTPLVANTDYQANTQSDGSGTDKTGQVTAVVTEDENERYTVTVTNNDSVDVYLTKLQMRGTPLVAYDAMSLEAHDNDSIVEHFKRTKVVDNALVSNQLMAQDYANYLLERHKDARTRIDSLVLNNATALLALHQLEREISDRITISSTEHGISDDFFIDGITMTLDNQTKQLRTEWKMTEGLVEYAQFDVDSFTSLDPETPGSPGFSYNPFGY